MANNQGSKPGALHKRNRIVAPNQRRIIVRPNSKPPRMYFVSSGGVMLLNDFKWSKAVKKALLARGYSLKMTGRSMYTFEKFVGGAS